MVAVRKVSPATRLLVGLAVAFTLAAASALSFGTPVGQHRTAQADTIGGGSAPSGYFLKIDGIDGGSAAEKHAGELDIKTFAFDVKQTASGGSGLLGGKPTFSPVTFTHVMDVASPKLFEAAASGMHFNTAVLTVVRGSSHPQPVLTVTLTDVTVTAYSVAGEANNQPEDTFSLTYRKIHIKYTSYSPDGKSSSTEGGWDVAGNKRV